MQSIVVLFVSALLIAMAFGIIMALPVMLLWDWLMPALFGLPEISFFQAWGLYIFCVIMFQSKVSAK